MIEFIAFLQIVVVIVLIVFMVRRTNKTVYLGALKEIDPSKEITTLTPVSVHAATCMHTWEVLTDKMLEMPHEKKYVLVLQCRGCGLIDKTVQNTSTAPPPAKPLPCKHEWLTEQYQNLDMPHEKKLVLVLKCKNCGALDKTIEVTSPAPLGKEQCRHKWDIEKRVLIESAYEQMLESIKVKVNSYSSTKKIDPNKELDLDLNEAPAWMFKKAYVSIRTCSLCGEVDKTIASNFEADAPEEVAE